MFIAMNRFRVAKGSEEAFEQVWMSRDSHLDKVPGFVEFHLLRGPRDRGPHAVCISYDLGKAVQPSRPGLDRMHFAWRIAGQGTISPYILNTRSSRASRCVRRSAAADEDARRSGRNLFRLSARHQSTVDAKPARTEKLRKRALDHVTQLGAGRTKSEQAGNGLDQLVLLGAVVLLYDPTNRYLDLLRRQVLRPSQRAGIDLASVSHDDDLLRHGVEKGPPAI